jgi:hypothetical protein
MYNAREDICEKIRVQSSDRPRPFAKVQVCTWGSESQCVQF